MWLHHNTFQTVLKIFIHVRLLTNLLKFGVMVYEDDVTPSLPISVHIITISAFCALIFKPSLPTHTSHK